MSIQRIKSGVIADSAVTAAKLDDSTSQLFGFRNRIINGAMEVAQRGTSHSSVGYGSLDRWYLNLSGGTGTLSQEINANPSETGGLKNYARLNVSSASDFTNLHQRIEDVRTVPSGTITLSFYAKGTAPAAGLYVYATQNFGSGGSSDVDISSVLVTASLTSEWVKYSVNITVPSIDGKTFGTSSYFLIAIGQYSSTASTAYDLNITGVQLEVGSVATPFERRPYGTELALCQRYFCVFNGSDGFGLVGSGVFTSTENARVMVVPPVEMRANPTAGQTSANVRCFNGSNTADDAGFASISQASTRVQFVNFSGSANFSATQPAIVQIYDDNTGKGFTLSAEL